MKSIISLLMMLVVLASSTVAFANSDVTENDRIEASVNSVDVMSAVLTLDFYAFENLPPPGTSWVFTNINVLYGNKQSGFLDVHVDVGKKSILSIFSYTKMHQKKHINRNQVVNLRRKARDGITQA